jgi:PAS domain S-box-containing protein
MPTILVVLFALGGFAASLGLDNLVTAVGDLQRSRESRDPVFSWFASMSFCFAGYLALQGFVYLSADIGAASALIRVQGFFLAFFLASIPGFGSALARRKMAPFDIACAGIFASLGAWSLVSPAGYWFSRIDSLEPMRTGALTLSTPRGPWSPTYLVSIILQFVVFGRQIQNARRAVKAGARIDGWVWGTAVAIMLVAGSRDHLVDLRILPPPYVGEYSFPLLMLTMAARMTGRRQKLWRDLERSRSELEAADVKFRGAFEYSGDALFIHDAATGEFIDTNPAMRRMYGYSLEEVKAKTISDLSEVGPDYSQESARAKIEEAKSLGYARFPWSARRKDGTVFPVEVSLNPFDMGGRPCVLASVREMTERQRALDELRGEKAFVEALLDGMPGIFYLHDPGLRLLRWNKNLEVASGYSPEELGLFSFRDWFPEGEARSAAEATGKAVLEGQLPVAKAELPLVMKDGRRVPYLLSIIRLEAPMGRSMLMGVGIDVSDRVRAEAAAKDSEERLRRVQRLEAVGQLAAGVAHDFNNLLSPILGYSSLLIDEAEPGTELRRGLELIYEASTRAQGITSQLMFLGREKAQASGRMEMARGLEGMRRLLASLLRENVSLDIRAEPGEYWIEASESRIEQVLMNLAVNARDAMPRGGSFRLRLERIQAGEEFEREHPECRKGPYAALSASDDGQGMSPEVRAKIFEPFFTTKESGQGTGLGLATVFGIVRGYGGAIEVESREGIGSTFRIFLPLSPAPAGEGRNEAGEARRGGGELILVVDDEEAVRAIACSVLEKAGYRAVAAESPAAALDMARKASEGGSEAPDLLLTDVIMPGMDGAELRERAFAYLPKLKFILMSGYPGDSLASPDPAAGGEDLLKKPFTSRELLGSVERALARGSPS